MRKIVLILTMALIMMPICIPACAQRTLSTLEDTIAAVAERYEKLYEPYKDSLSIFQFVRDFHKLVCDSAYYVELFRSLNGRLGVTVDSCGVITLNGKKVELRSFSMNSKYDDEELSTEIPPLTAKMIEKVKMYDKLIADSISRSKHNVYNTSYVDLGLSVNWATCNVGADKPEDYGDYFAWGETEPKSEYTWENYKFRKSGDEVWNVKLSKYGIKVDGKTVLDPEDDVAHVKWGGSWRIPSEAEFQELFNNCTTTRDSLNGIYGYRFTSNLPGYTDRSIFLPDAGNKWLSKIRDEGSCEYYVNSLYVIPGQNLDKKALVLLINSHPIKLTLVCDRCEGYPIRPVCPKEEITIDEFEE